MPYLVPLFRDGTRSIIVFPSRIKNKHILSCLSFYGHGNTVTDCPLANEIIPIRAKENENQPENYYPRREKLRLPRL